MSRRSIGSVLAIAMMTACSGGGSSQSGPNGVPATQAPTKNGPLVEARIVLPNAKAKSAKRTRSYISPGTAGLVVTVQQVAGSTVSTYSRTGYDLTASSNVATCTKGATNTTCVIFFEAPATTSTQSDLFFLYAYDTAQTDGAVTESYVPAGQLLSEDTGTSDGGDPVPSTATGNAAIVAGQTNDVLFVLKPVVKTPVASIGGVVAGSTAPLVLSVPGSGGQSNTLSVDGIDGANNPIANNLVAGSGDDAYVNPIQDTISPSQFALSISPVTSALDDGVVVTYTPLAGDQPTTATSTALNAKIQVSDSLTDAGYGGVAQYPLAGQSVTVAPLFAYADPPVTTASGFSTTVYALQSALPTPLTGYTDYTLTAQSMSATNDCSAYTIGAPQAGAPSPSSQQATFAISTTATPLLACELLLSDGISTVSITFTTGGTQSP